jgi:hypothetical protein
MFIIVGNVWKKHVVTSRAPTLVCMLEPARAFKTTDAFILSSETVMPLV